MDDMQWTLGDTVLRWQLLHHHALSVQEYCLWDAMCKVRAEDFSIQRAARFFGITRQTVAKMLQRLEQRGLVERDGIGFKVMVRCEEGGDARREQAPVELVPNAPQKVEEVEIAQRVEIKAPEPPVLEDWEKEAPAQEARTEEAPAPVVRKIKVRKKKAFEDMTLFGKYQEAFFIQMKADGEEEPQWNGQDAKAMKKLIQHMENIYKVKYKEDAAKLQEVPDLGLKGWMALLKLRKLAWGSFERDSCKRLNQIEGRLTNIISSCKQYTDNNGRNQQFNRTFSKANSRYEAGSPDKVF